MTLSNNNFNILTSVIVLPDVQCDDSSTYLIDTGSCKCALLHVINKLSKQALNLILENTVFFIYSLETSFHLLGYIKKYLHVS